MGGEEEEKKVDSTSEVESTNDFMGRGLVTTAAAAPLRPRPCTWPLRRWRLRLRLRRPFGQGASAGGGILPTKSAPL